MSFCYRTDDIQILLLQRMTAKPDLESNATRRAASKLTAKPLIQVQITEIVASRHLKRCIVPRIFRAPRQRFPFRPSPASVGLRFSEMDDASIGCDAPRRIHARHTAANVAATNAKMNKKTTRGEIIRQSIKEIELPQSVPQALQPNGIWVVLRLLTCPKKAGMVRKHRSRLTHPNIIEFCQKPRSRRLV